MQRVLKIILFLAIAVTTFCWHVEALDPPACQGPAPNVPALNNVLTATLNNVTFPFGLVYATTGNFAFAATGPNLTVLDTSQFAPRVLHQIPLHATTPGLGIALTTNGRYVLVAGGLGATIVASDKAIAGSPDAVVGVLSGPAALGQAAIEVTVSADDQYAFVSQEYGTSQTGNRGNIEVFKLIGPSTNGSISGNYIGNLTLGGSVVGTKLSPNGRTLYATSEIYNSSTTQGSLSVIDVATLQTNPSKALISSFDAGCSPVRVIVSQNGKTVWVTARESNHLLAFNATKLRSNSQNALIASVQVGTSPVGLIFARNETRILTADSNRFNQANSTTGLSVVDVKAALQGKPALLGQIPTGKFPREFAASRDGKTILVSDNGSNQIQAINVTTLP